MAKVEDLMRGRLFGYINRLKFYDPWNNKVHGVFSSSKEFNLAFHI